MNKFNFINQENEHIKKLTSNVSRQQYSLKEEKSFYFNFTSNTNENIDNYTVYEDEDRSRRREDEDRLRRRLGPVVKSEIKENVITQLKIIKENVKCSEEELMYFKMNDNTKRKFRMFYSYEVDQIVKNEEDKKIGKIIGNVMGIKIIQDNSLQNDIVLIVTNKKSKFEMVFSEGF